MKGAFSTIELIISMSLISLVLLLSFPIIKSDSRAIEYETALLKSKIRENQILAQNTGGYLKIKLYKNAYKIIKSNGTSECHIIRNGVYLSSLDSVIDYSNYDRSGAPKKGQSIFFYDSKNNLARKITIMLASGRVQSYDVNFQANKYMLKSSRMSLNSFE